MTMNEGEVKNFVHSIHKTAKALYDDKSRGRMQEIVLDEADLELLSKAHHMIGCVVVNETALR